MEISTDQIYYIAAVVYLVWCVINAMIADAKGVSLSTTLLFSIAFTPLLGYLYVTGMPKK